MVCTIFFCKNSTGRNLRVDGTKVMEDANNIFLHAAKILTVVVSHQICQQHYAKNQNPSRVVENNSEIYQKRDYWGAGSEPKLVSNCA